MMAGVGPSNLHLNLNNDALILETTPKSALDGLDQRKTFNLHQNNIFNPTTPSSHHPEKDDSKCKSKNLKLISSIELKLRLESLQMDIQQVLLENDKYRSKTEELEKWLLLLTNNFYAGHPDSIETLDKCLQK